MKAFIIEKYGSPNNLKLQEVEKPTPKENEVLIKVHATAINSWDWDYVTGHPYLYRLFSGLFKPRFKIPGLDVAGVIEAVGSKVKRLKPGDEVLGDISTSKWGAYAEYVCAKEEVLAIKPQKMSFEEAAAIPHAGCLAYQGLKFDNKLQAGKQVLINGAGGGVGTFALQMLKTINAEVTCVDSDDKLEKLMSLGAYRTIDYKKTDFTREGIKYDYILDNTAQKKIADYKRALKPEGIFAATGGRHAVVFGVLLFKPLYSLGTNKKLEIVAHRPSSDNIDSITNLYETGALKPIISKIYAFNEIPEALSALGSGKHYGKLVVNLI